MKPVRIVAHSGSPWFMSVSRSDLRRIYRRLRTDLGLPAWEARSIITSIVLSGTIGKAQP